MKNSPNFRLLIVSVTFFFLCLPPMTNGLTIQAPKVSNVVQLPPEPPPNYPVNITCLVASDRDIASVDVKYSINDQQFLTIKMVLVEGNETRGTYFASLPSKSLGTVMKYYIVAEDIAGFEGKSEIFKYVVKTDQTLPSIYEQYRAVPETFPDGPITEWDYAKIRVAVSDQGSGVKQVVLYYDFGELPPWNFQNNLTMHLVQGDMYDGEYYCLVSPQQNGTTVVYHIEATDFAGNRIRTPDEDSYQVFTPTKRYCDFQIKILNINPENYSIAFSIFTVAYLPSQWMEKAVIRCDLMMNNQTIDILFFGMQMYNTMRFYYQEEEKWNAPLWGYPEFYPFDSYSLSFKFQIYFPDLNQTNTRIEGPYLDHLSQYWQAYNTTSPKFYSEDLWSVVEFSFVVKRRADTEYLMLPIYAGFFILGSTLVFSYNEQDFEKRRDILLGLFIFSSTFLFAMYSFIPHTYGLSVPQVLLISNLTASALFLVVSLFVTNFMTKHNLHSKPKSMKYEPLADLLTLIVALFIIWTIGNIRIFEYFKNIFAELPFIWYILVVGLSSGILFKFSYGFFKKQTRESE